jgi:hypothetical protein
MVSRRWRECYATQQDAIRRLPRDIAQYTELSQQTMQLTAIISDSVKKLPTGASNLLH